MLSREYTLDPPRDVETLCRELMTVMPALVRARALSMHWDDEQLKGQHALTALPTVAIWEEASTPEAQHYRCSERVNYHLFCADLLLFTSERDGQIHRSVMLTISRWGYGAGIYLVRLYCNSALLLDHVVIECDDDLDDTLATLRPAIGACVRSGDR
jgi:hypothetical protein